MLGSTAAGAGLLVGTGAFSAAGTGHGVSIQAGDSDLHVELNDEYEGDAGSYVTEDPLELDVEVGDDEWIRFDDLLRVTNTGTQPVTVYVGDEEWLGDDADAVLDYRVDGTVVGEDNGVTLEDAAGDNSETFTVLVDATGHDTVEDALPDTDGDDDTHTVRFVAETTDADSGSGEEDSDEDDDDDEEDDTENGDGVLEVDADNHVTVGSDNTFDVTATVTDEGHGGGDATVTLDIEGNQLEPHEETITVPEDSEVEATFEVPTVYDDLDADDTESGRHGDFRFDGTDWTVTVDYAGETDAVTGTLDVEDAAIKFYEPDGDVNCPVCNMGTKTWEDSHGQVTHANGDRMEFCSDGCIVPYVVDPGQYDGDYVTVPDAPIEGVWVVDFTDLDDDGNRTGDGTDLIDGHEAYFVLDYDASRETQHHIMGANPPSFAAYDDALAYVDTYDDLEEADIVTLDDFDADIAEEYRPNSYEP
ncbi:hypothetical protein C500_15085 [Natrialba magadii ATCC 43099]|nr:hypothetical protein C500_15085 [Natrialba magadii ATCC 43099]